MSPPHHISHFLLLPITGLQVNTSSKLPEAYHYYRSPCHHFAIYLNLYYYLLHFYRSTCRQSPKNHTLLQVAMSPPRHISHSLLLPTTGQHPVKTPKIIPLLQVTMSPPHHISFSTTTYYRSTDQHVVKALRIILYYRSTCPHLAIYLILYYYLLQVNTSSKPSEAYQYHRSPCHHLVIYLILHYYLPQVYRSTRRQNPQNQSITTGHHVNTSPYILISSTTYYRSTGQHVVKIPRFIQIPQVTMSPPRHISFSLLLPTTGLQVNTSSNPSEAYHYHRSPCPHLAIYLILYYYLPQVYRSTRRQNPQKHTITTGHHVPTSPYISFSTTTYYMSTGQHVVKTPRIIPLPQDTMSLPHHISHPLLLLTTSLQVNTSSKPSEAYHYHRSPCPHLAIYLILYYYLPQVYRSTRRQNPQKHTITTGHHVPTSPYISFSTTTYYMSTGQHVVKTPRIIPLPQVTMSPPHHISHSLLLPTTGLQVNTSSKPSEAYHYHRSPCPHLAIYLILYYYLPQVYRSPRRQNPQKHTITTGHHVPTSPYISFSTTTYYMTTGQHIVKTPRIIPLLQVTMSSPHHMSYSPLIISLII